MSATYCRFCARRLLTAHTGVCYGCAAARSDLAQSIEERVMALAATPVYAVSEDDYACPNCVTPWKCNGPHEPAYGEPVDHDISRAAVLAIVRKAGKSGGAERPATVWGEAAAGTR